MKCQRLQKLIKNWYAQVQDEAMAPARMVAFMERHLGECLLCLADPNIKKEAAEIAAFVLPAEKIRKPELAADDTAEDAEEPEGEGANGEEEAAQTDEEDESDSEEDLLEDDI